jgi:hypothetical protein
LERERGGDSPRIGGEEEREEGARGPAGAEGTIEGAEGARVWKIGNRGGAIMKLKRKESEKTRIRRRSFCVG